MFDDSPAATGLLDMSDADLLRMHTEGNKAAFGVLYQRHRSRLWAVAARIAGGQDADDAMQNAMLRAYSCAGGFRGDSAVTSWLHRIVMNAAFDVTRRRPQSVPLGCEPPCAAWPTAEADTRMDVRKQQHVLIGRCRGLAWQGLRGGTDPARTTSRRPRWAPAGTGRRQPAAAARQPGPRGRRGISALFHAAESSVITGNR
jgi:Sigma-70 region 2